jgi:hypothetical protein
VTLNSVEQGADVDEAAPQPVQRLEVVRVARSSRLGKYVGQAREARPRRRYQ